MNLRSHKAILDAIGHILTSSQKRGNSVRRMKQSAAVSQLLILQMGLVACVSAPPTTRRDHWAFAEEPCGCGRFGTRAGDHTWAYLHVKRQQRSVSSICMATYNYPRQFQRNVACLLTALATCVGATCSLAPANPQSANYAQHYVRLVTAVPESCCSSRVQMLPAGQHASALRIQQIANAYLEWALTAAPRHQDPAAPAP